MQTETCIFPLPLEIMAWFKCSVVFTYLFQIFAHIRSSRTGAVVLEPRSELICIIVSSTKSALAVRCGCI